MARKCLDEGEWKENRTGIRTIGYIGDFCKYDLSQGFPIVTTKRMAIQSCIGEMIGFLRGYDNAGNFRNLGSSVWDANANENAQWLANPSRKGTEDLGRIYGVQARNWRVNHKSDHGAIDQLKNVIDDLGVGIDNRREIVTHWNPSEMDEMALPPCHVLYQFGIQGGKLCLSMYQRSCDIPLGVPFNIMGYAWLLTVIARICDLPVGTLNHYLHDIHIYENQVDTMRIQLEREPKDLPTLCMSDDIECLDDLETWVTPRNFWFENYEHHPALKYEFAV